MAILAVIMYGLWRQRNRLKHARPELAHMVTAFLFSLTAFVIGAAFAHLSYQRYFWLLLALSSAALRIAHSYQPYQTEEPPGGELFLPEEELS
jgi:hypothetical protein